MNKLTEHYRCLKCFFEYFGKPGPTKCPKCGHLYVKWVNYPERGKKLVK